MDDLLDTAFPPPGVDLGVLLRRIDLCPAENSKSGAGHTEAAEADDAHLHAGTKPSSNEDGVVALGSSRICGMLPEGHGLSRR
jgi:hypothetical protein